MRVPRSDRTENHPQGLCIDTYAHKALASLGVLGGAGARTTPMATSAARTDSTDDAALGCDYFCVSSRRKLRHEVRPIALDDAAHFIDDGRDVVHRFNLTSRLVADLNHLMGCDVAGGGEGRDSAGHGGSDSRDSGMSVRYFVRC